MIFREIIYSFNNRNILDSKYNNYLKLNSVNIIKMNNYIIDFKIY